MKLLQVGKSLGTALKPRRESSDEPEDEVPQNSRSVPKYERTCCMSFCQRSQLGAILLPQTWRVTIRSVHRGVLAGRPCVLQIPWLEEEEIDLENRKMLMNTSPEEAVVGGRGEIDRLVGP